MTLEREAELRELALGWWGFGQSGAIECLDAIAVLRKEWEEEHEMWHSKSDECKILKDKLNKLSKRYCSCPMKCFVCSL